MKTLATPIIGMLLAAALPARAAEIEPYRGPIIDVHLHALPTKQIQSLRRGSAKPANAASPLPEHRAAANADSVLSSALGVNRLDELPELDEEGHFKATLAAMDRFNVVLGFVSGNHARSVAWAEAAPGRFRIGESSGNVERARNAKAAGKIDYIGEWGAQYRGLAPTDPELAPLWAWAEEQDLPVAYHMHPGPPGAPFLGSKLRTAYGRPLLLEDVLRKHPRLRLYVMHAGWPFADEMIALLWDYPQVYVDLAVINWTLSRGEFHGYLKRLVDAGMIDRIMFGSDQMEWPEAIAKAIAAVDSAPFLSAAQKRAIFHDNAVRFFRLPPATAPLPR